MVGAVNNLLRFLTALVLLVVNSHATARQWALANLGLSAVLCLGTFLLVAKQMGMPRFSLTLSIKRMGEGSAFSLAGSASSLYNDFDKTMLSHYGMYAANGIYSVAYRVVNMASMPAFSIEMAALPRLFQRRGDGFRDLARYGNSLLRRSLLVGASMTVALFLAAPLLPHLLGRDFAESVHALRWLALLPLFRSAHLLLGGVLTGAGFQPYRTTSQLAIAGFNFALNLWLIPAHGWLGAAWSSLATDGLLVAVYWLLIRWQFHRPEQRIGTTANGVAGQAVSRFVTGAVEE